MPKYNIPDLRTSGNGKYAYTFDWGRRADGSRHQETRSGFNTKREANDDYQKLLVEREATKANKMMATTSRSFGQFVEDDFLPNYQDGVRPQTYRGRAAMIHKHFQSLSKFELSEITPEMVMKWKNQLRHHQSLSNEYVRKICGLCHRIFSLAVDMKLLSTNPAEVLKKTKFLRGERWHGCQKRSIGTCRYVFSTTGIPMNRMMLERLIHQKAMETGVPIIRNHDLRHSHASLLIEQGANPLLVRDRLGHSDVKITLQTYGHLYPNRDASLAQSLDGLVTFPSAKPMPQELDGKSSQRTGEEPEK